MNLINKVGQNIFPIAIVILTFVLLIVFGIQQSEEEGISNDGVINKFYSATLKPIFSSQEIEKEDVLNFALDGDLILDSAENKALQISSDSTGKEVIGIKGIEKSNAVDNYNKVVEKLKLQGDRKAELDSILESYYASLSKSVFKDKNKIYAIDPKIGQLRSSLNNDLLNFIRDNKSKSEKEHSSKHIFSSREEDKIRNFIVFTPDTVLKQEFEWQAEKAKLSIPKNIRIPKKPEIKTNNSSKEFEGLDFSIDSNLVKVTLDNIINHEDLEDLDFFKALIDSTNDSLNLSLKILGDSSNNLLFKIGYTDSANNKVKYEMNTDDIGKVISNSVKIFSGKDLEDWIEFGIKMDSISRKLDEKKKIKSEKEKKNN